MAIRTLDFDDGDIIIEKCNYFHSDRYALYELNAEDYRGKKSEFVLRFKEDVIGVVPARGRIVVLREKRGDDDDETINLVIRKKEQYKLGYLYVVKLDKYYKIGISKNPDDRLKEFTLPPYELENILILKVKDYDKREKELHEHFADKRVRGEWFELNAEDIEYIKEYLKEYEVE